MQNTYKAVEVASPGKLNLVTRPVPEPGPRQVRVRVEAAGICHSDVATVEAVFPGIRYPRVPGHEIAGYIEAVGENVSGWKTGQRVGIGWFGGECGHCEPCRRGDFVNCENLIISGVTTDGGYAEVVIVESRALASIPDGVTPANAAPLLCAGVTTYNALRNAKLRAGDLVAIQGIGGLGHLAVQFARRMGFRTVAIARGKEKEKLARELGAQEYIDSASGDPAEQLHKLGGANSILATAANSKSQGPLMGGLAPRGKLIVVGVGSEPIEINPAQLIFGSRTIQGEVVGTSIDEEDTLDFSALQAVRPMIERVPLEQAAEAYAKMMRNEARFRMVIDFSL
jgi:D-arabinose 1-dehydrogenase-like Zn-dependent alcohol dehydrogenase